MICEEGLPINGFLKNDSLSRTFEEGLLISDVSNNLTDSLVPALIASKCTTGAQNVARVKDAMSNFR